MVKKIKKDSLIGEERDKIDDKIIDLIRQEPDITDKEIAERFSLRLRDIQKRIDRLSDTRYKILIIDDEEIINALRISLESEGYVALGAPTGQRGIEGSLRIIPDLILMELELPDMDGLDVIDRLRKDSLTKLIPIIIVSKRRDVDSKIKGYDRGADAYLTKPFNIRELKARIRAVLRRCMV